MTLALDPVSPAAGQQGINFFGTSQTATLTTTGGSGVIILSLITGTDLPNLPTAPGLTFVLRSPGSVSCNGGAGLITHFWAPYTTNFSGTITCTTAGTGQTVDVQVTGVSGASITGVVATTFDPGGPVTSTSGLVTETTANANDFVFNTYFSTSPDSSSGNTGGAWGALFTSGMNQHMFQWLIVSATGLQSPTLATGGPALGGIVDAVVQAGGGAPAVTSPFPSGMPRLIMLKMDDQ